MANQFNVSNKRVFAGTGIALAVNIVIYLIGSAAAATWNVGMPMQVGLALVASATVVPFLLGGLVVGLLAKWKQSLVGVSSWAVLIFSIVGAPGGYIASNDLPTGIALGAMHFVVGAAWFLAIRGKK